MSQHFATCHKCGTKTDAKGAFCWKCGAPTSARNQNLFRPELAPVIEGIQATLRKQPAQDRLPSFAITESEINSPADELAITWAMRMRCHAELGQLVEAEESAFKAREAYARHLKLDDLEIERYVKTDFSIWDSEAFTARSLQDSQVNPWLVPLFEGGLSPRLPLEHVIIGETHEERLRNVTPSWTYFGEEDELRRLLAILCFRSGRYREAAAILDGVNRSPELRGCEIRGELQREMFWPLIVMGQCYSELDDHERAIICWQKARSLELYAAQEKQFFDEFAHYWINKAKDALSGANVSIPSNEDSDAAAEHLAAAWSWMLRAESWMAGMGLDQQLVTKFNLSGDVFRDYVTQASIALTWVRKLDPFTRARVTSPDGVQVWITTEPVEAEILHMRGVIHLLMDEMAEAISAFSQSSKTSTSLASYLWLGLANELAGKITQAREIYKYIIAYGRSLANPLTEGDDATCEEFTSAARSLLAEPLS